MDSAITALGDFEPNGRGGGKTNGLRWLADHGFAVPPTWVIADPDVPADIMRSSLETVIRSGIRYAVRSSANVEDGGSVSYAGQFVSLLDVEGVDAVLEGAATVSRSSDTASVRSYREHQGDARPVAMSVIVQEMVTPVFSGVAFSKNPITGLSEIVVEAVPGRGDALMAGGATPDRWVHRWGDYVESPEAADTDAHVVDLVVAGTAEIASKYGSPVDVEWVYDGHQVWWVQVRSVTGLDEVTIYSRRIAKEVMPGIIKPLVWSVNVPMVNQAWVDLFTEALGDTDIAPEDLAKPFGYRAYFNMSTIGEIFTALGMPRESLEVLLGLPAGSDQPGFKPTATTFRKTPRLVGMALRKWRYAAEVERQLPSLEAEYARYVGRDLKSVSDTQLLADIGQLRRIGVRAASLNIVTPLLANVYTALLRRGLGKSGVDLESIDLMEGVDGRDSFDPNPELDALGGRIEALSGESRESIGRDGYEGLPADLRAEVDRFIGRFGHFSDAGTDFSVAPWREQPDTVVTMAMDRPGRGRTSLLASWNTIQREVPAWRRPLMGLLRR
ncbi:MAG: hypothetical protein KJO84_01400, partial [Acidimicrobiia bacterium]|nr:hypothetical protein [Acidimicrobiia bacterium]